MIPKLKENDVEKIYEMFNISQYCDGSVLNCLTGRTYTARQVIDAHKAGQPEYNMMDGVLGFPDEPKGMTKLVRDIFNDIRRNAKAALKNGGTRNLAPRVRR